MSHILEFLDLVDVPNTYSGLPGRPVIVNATVSGVTFSDLAADFVSLNSLSFGGVLNSGTQDVQTAMATLDDHVHNYYLLRSEWAQNGFVDRTEVAVAWDDGTRTLTISPAVTSFDYYYAGYKYTETGSLAATITDTEGLWVFYISEGGAVGLEALHNPSYAQVEDVIRNQTIVAYVYWDATNNDGRLMDERHGARMSPETHHYLHELFRAQYASGMTLGDILVDQNGSSDTHAQFSITAGRFYDEDIEHDTLARASTDTWECYYVDGSGDVRWVDCEATFPVYAIGGVIAYNNAGTLTAVAAQKYVLYHVFSTNIHTDAGGDYYPIVIPGIAEYSSKAAAQDAALSEIQSIDFGDWPTEEIIPIATVIFLRGAAMSNGVTAAIQSTEGGGDFVDWRFTAISGSSISVNDHGGLSGLGDVADHPGYVTLDGLRPLTADWDAGGYEIRALTFESDVATGTAPFTIASTTLNTNLNADLLDGEHASAFADAAHSHTESDITDLDHTDATAIHDNVAGEINAITAKATPVSADVLVIEDSAASYAKKKITIGDISVDPVAKSMIDLYKGASSSQTVPLASPVDITWENERYKDSEFIHSASSAEIEFDFDGRVLITAEFTADCTGTARYRADWWALLDTGGGYSEIAGTKAGSYHRTTGPGIDTASIRFMLNISNGDKIKFQGQSTDATAVWTVDHGCRVTIEKLTETAATSYNDDNAIHDNVANEITAITAKTSLAAADEFVLEDSAASYVKKAVTVSNLATYVRGTITAAGFDTTAIHDNVASEISAITAKASPTSADYLLIEDAAASNAKKRITIGDLPAPTATAPKTIAVTNTTGSYNGLTYTTVASGSSGPYIIHLFGNSDTTDSGYFKLTVDGTVLFTDVVLSAGQYAVGVGAVYYAGPIAVRESFTAEVHDYGPDVSYRISYQQVSVS